MGKKNGKMFPPISQKWQILGQLHWTNGVIKSFQWLKWGIVSLCKSNSSWDTTKIIKNIFLKNQRFCKKKLSTFNKWSFSPFLPSALIIKVMNGGISPFMS